jgi:hypothetical protein
VKGWLHPARPSDIPADVAGWLDPVSRVLQALDAEGRAYWR